MIKKIQNNKMKPTDPCYCHSGLPYNECHLPIEKRLRDLARIGVEVPKREMVKTKEQVEGIRKSAEINIAVLDYVAKNIKEGISTWEIDRWVSEITRDMGCFPSTMKDSRNPSVPPSMTRYVTAFRPGTSFCSPVILSMSTALPSVTDIFPILPECL